MAFESRGSQRFPYTYEQVFAGLLRILPANGYKVKSHNRDIGRIECAAGMSWMSFGENIAISVEDIDGYSTRVEIHSGLKIQGNRNAIFTGESRNARNVSVIISALSNYLKTQQKPVRPAAAVPAAPPPLPSSTPAYFVYIKDEVKGPFSATQIKALLQVDSVTPTTPCMPQRGQEWQIVADFIS